MMPTYGQEIVWTCWNGDRRSVCLLGFDTAEEAVRETIKLAQRMGWTYPRWWQIWRWYDTRPELPVKECAHGW